MKTYFNKLNKLKLKPKTIILISVFIFIVMAVSAYFEVTESKKEIIHLLAENATSLVETISLSSHNTLNSSYEMEDLMAEKLLDNARLIKRLDSIKTLTNTDLNKLSLENNLYRIVIYNKKGNTEKISCTISDTTDTDFCLINKYIQLEQILNGQENELVLGMQKAKNTDDQRYAVAVSRSNKRGAIVIYLDANDLLSFRKKIGIGMLLQKIGNFAGIEYLVLQDTLGILAASKSIDSINSINNDPYLYSALETDSMKMRMFDFNGTKVYEVVKRLYHDNEVIGIFRIGLSLDELDEVELRTTNRIITFSIILGLFSIIILSILFTSQNLKMITDEFSRFRTFTSSILENLGEAVVVINNELEIKLFNKYAELLFCTDSAEAAGKNARDVLPASFLPVFNEILYNDFTEGDFENNCEINRKKKHLVISIKKNWDEDKNPEGFSLVIRDLTENKRLEDLSKRNEKLTAMGELASGVAHEIRNPINSIGMIAQRLNKEFEPNNDAEDYHRMVTVLKSEVARVNTIVTQFLNYSRPLELQLQETDFDRFINEVYNIFSSQAKVKNLDVKLICTNNVKVKIDTALMIQAIMNLLQNAYDAVEQNGKIEINCQSKKGFLKIKITDNGIGIAEEKQNKIFDLYYTSKKEGNGLGLSITQKIINQHNGEISFKSKENSGSIFTIKIPVI